MFKSIFNFIGEILKQVIVKILTFVIIIIIILFTIKHYLGVDMFSFLN